MIKIIIAFVFVALLLLIMRVSHLNEHVSSIDEQLSDYATRDYIDEYIKLRASSPSSMYMKGEVNKLKEKCNKN